MKKVPKLRFKEFEKEWEEKKIGDITNLTAGGTPNTLKKEYWNGNIKWMNSGELNLKFIYDVQGRITELGLKNSSTKLIPEKCILIGLAGQGKTRGTVAINFIELCTNQSIASILPNFNYFKPMFLYYNLDNRYEELRNLSTGSNGRGGLNLNILKRISVFFPILKEQEKIADFLSSVDVKINLTENKLELLKEYKKGIMQKIFNQELRFKDENGNDYPKWEEKSFDTIFKIVQNKNYQIKNSEILNKGIFKVIDQGKNKIAGFSNEKDKVFKNIPIILYGDHTTIIKYLDFNFILGGDGTKLLSSKSNDKLKFLYYALDYNNITPEGYKRHFSILREIHLMIPLSLEEQQKIADFLSSIDEKIEKLSSKLEELKEFKKGLLQQMFV